MSNKTIRLNIETHELLDQMSKKFGGSKQKLAEECIKGISRMGIEPRYASRNQIADSIQKLDKDFQSFIHHFENQHLSPMGIKAEKNIRLSEAVYDNQKELTNILNRLSIQLTQSKNDVLDEKIKNYREYGRRMFLLCQKFNEVLLSKYPGIKEGKGLMPDSLRKVLINYLEEYRKIKHLFKIQNS